MQKGRCYREKPGNVHANLLKECARIKPLPGMLNIPGERKKTTDCRHMEENPPQ
jgi:hypothetical protein